MPPKGPSTKELVQIADIRDSIVIFKNGSLRSVLEISPINFALKSADEQAAIVAGFQSFLNAIDFPLQIVVSSRKLNLGGYIASFEALTQNMANELLQIQASEYIAFVKDMADLYNIMSKRFYCVIPFHVAAVGSDDSGLNLMGKMKGLFAPSSIVRSLDEKSIEKYRGQLEQRIGVVGSSLGGLGLSSRLLGYDELLNIYYDYYNPGQAARGGPEVAAAGK